MQSREETTHRSVLLHSGTVRTGVEGAPLQSWVRIDDGRITATGDGSPPDMPGADRVDLRGRLLLPGFCDAHVHLAWIATALLGCDLSGCDSTQSVLDTLAAYRGPGRGPGGAWVVGYGFDESAWNVPRVPTRDELDALESRRPVLLQRVCGHVGIVNGVALARIDDGPHTDRRSGRIAEDDLYAVNDLLRPGVEELVHALPEVLATLHRHGVTAVHDVTSPEMLAALQRVHSRGALAAHVSCSIPARFLERPADVGSAGDAAAFFRRCGLDQVPVDRHDTRLRVLGVKLFVDGSLGARTAFLRQGYADAPATRGVPLYEPGELAALARAVDAAGLQLMVHAIGDAAIDRALDALEPVLAGGNPQRHRLEHLEVTPADLVERLAHSGVEACVQPNFAGRWSVPGGMNEQRLGAARLPNCNAYRTLHQAGVPLAFGSDCMPFGPLYGVRAAVHHPVATERLDAGTAWRLYGGAGARLTHAGAAFGRIEPGCAADLVLLDRDPRTEADWEALRVEATFFGGRVVAGALA